MMKYNLTFIKLKCCVKIAKPQNILVDNKHVKNNITI